MAKRKRMHGRIMNVWEEELGTELTADAVAGTKVLYVDDVSPFNDDDEEPGGWLQVGDQVIEYTTVDDDASTITLATALTATVTADGDEPEVWVWNDLYDQVDTVQWAQVMPDGKRDLADAIEAVVDTDRVSGLQNGDRGRPRENCLLERDGDEWEVIRVKGRPSKATNDKTLFFQDSAIASGPGDLDVPLTHLPVENSEHVYWNGIYQPGSEWSRDGQLIVVPDPDSYFLAGDEVAVEYAYRTGAIVTPTVPEPVPTVDPAASNVWQISAPLGGYEGTGINTSYCGGTTFLGQVGSVSYPRPDPTFAGQNRANVAQQPALPPWVEGIKVYIVYDGDENPDTHYWSDTERTCTGTAEAFGPPSLKINTGGSTVYRPGDPDTGTDGYARTTVAGTGVAAYLCKQYAGSYLLNRIRTSTAVTITIGGRGASYDTEPPSSIHREWTVNSVGLILVYPEV